MHRCYNSAHLGVVTLDLQFLTRTVTQRDQVNNQKRITNRFLESSQSIPEPGISRFRTLGRAGEGRGLFLTSIHDSESRSGRLADRPLGISFRLLTSSILGCAGVEALGEPVGVKRSVRTALHKRSRLFTPRVSAHLSVCPRSWEQTPGS